MKKRIIPSILLRGGTNVSLSQQFTPWRTVGALAQQLRLHVRRNCDEILIINTDLAGTSSFVCPQRLLTLVRQEVDIPIAYAGGISSAKDAALCVNAGFDKVYLTSAFIDNPSVVCDIAGLVDLRVLVFACLTGVRLTVTFPCCGIFDPISLGKIVHYLMRCILLLPLVLASYCSTMLMETEVFRV